MSRLTTTDKIFGEAWEQTMPEHSGEWLPFVERIKMAMQEMEDLLRDAVDHADRRTVTGVKTLEKIETYLGDDDE